MPTNFLHGFRYAALILYVGLFFLGLMNYKGSAWVYLAFSLVSTLSLYSGLRANALFFETFISVFFWLGFWLKVTIRIVFSDGVMGEATGYFDGTGSSFDRALLVSACGLCGLLCASAFRARLYPQHNDRETTEGNNQLAQLYWRFRIPLVFCFVLAVCIVVGLNVYLGIYQKGTVTRTILPWGLNGAFKWLLLFGFASISALFIRLEMERPGRGVTVVMLVSLFECFASNVSQLSRGMILNASAILYGALVTARKISLRVERATVILVGIVFVGLFVFSVFSVNYIRSAQFYDRDSGAMAETLHRTTYQTNRLFIDRWVGMEGVMAVSSYPGLGWDIWREAWREVYDEGDTSLFDKTFITSPYVNTDKLNHHFISLPGAIAFFFYPGSFVFLFLCMMVLGLCAIWIEIAAFKLAGKNLILCSVIGQVIAYRYASFGYVPQQSYLLFGTLIANILIFYSFIMAFRILRARRSA